MEILAIGRSIFDLLFPRRCLNCDAVISDRLPLCISCITELPYTHFQFNRENLAYEKLSTLCELEQACSLLFFRHDNVTQKLLHHLKYHGRQEIGELLADKLNEMVSFPEFDGLITMPIHPKKMKKRGYNQVYSFAFRLANLKQIPLIDDVLIRVENNPSQVTKNRRERLNSIQNAFALSKELQAGHYLVIDDLMTTGATLSICVNLLNKQNGVKISVLTMAVAG